MNNRNACTRRACTAALHLAIVTALAHAPLLHAQDTRNITEPKVPPACKVLTARYTIADGKLPGAVDDACASDSTACDTRRVQDALDACSATASKDAVSAAVVLKADGARAAFILQPLQLRSGVALVVDKGVTAFASANPRDYDITPGLCGTLSTGPARGCHPLLSVEKAKHTAIMGPGTIDGRGYMKIRGTDQTWWQIARAAENTEKHQNCYRILVANNADDLTLYNVMVKNSPNFHIVVNGTNGFTAWGVRIDTPEDARNTDGIDPGNSDNITITHSYLHTGDDNVAIKSGGNGTHHITVSHNHFYSGHGISIGSGTLEGVSDMLVTDLTMDGTANGVRIKSDVTRGGLVNNITYENICMKNVTAPIAISPFYNDTTVDPFAPTRFKGDKIPVYRNIVIRNVHALTPGSVLLAGWDATHRTEVTLDNVSITGLQPQDIHMQETDVLLGPGPVNFTPQGKNVAVKPVTGEAAPATGCSMKSFVPFPH